MTQSPEYPNLKWLPPKSWTNANRTDVQLVVIHTTEGSAHIESAEDGAAYDARRTDGTSTHYFHDADSTVQCVRTEDQAHTARKQGNRRGIHHELCTRAGSANWSNEYHVAMLQRAARQAARDCKKWDIPVRHLTVSEVADGIKGFAGHYDITRAFPGDGGTHTDPGANFPWSRFLDMVRAELTPPAKPAAPKPQEDDMPISDDDATKIGKAAARETWAFKFDDPYTVDDPKNPGADDKTAGAMQRFADSRGQGDQTRAQIEDINTRLSRQEGILNEILAALKPAEPTDLPAQK